MKIFLSTLCLLWFGIGYGQLTHVHGPSCGTHQAMEDHFKKNPGARVVFENNRSALLRNAEMRKNAALESTQNRIQQVFTVPVVFHVLIPNPAQVTDAQLLAQLKTMNDDFAGGNADSVNIPEAFKPLFGKSTIQFCLAQRNPDDEPSTGILRRSSSVTSFPGTGDPAKYSNLGGSDAWDPSRYLNIWVVNISGNTLGYTFLPGSGIPFRETGLVLNFRFTGSGGTATAPFNLGRTGTHELGHFFGLQHIWGGGDNIRSCTDSDGVADTPNQDTANFGAPAFPRLDACTPNFPGVMFMNYMDYVDDRAMVMFTSGQVFVMETALNNSNDRNSLLLSNGCTPPVVPNLDARLRSINGLINGSITCAGSNTITGIVRNVGSTSLSSIRLNYSINGAAPQQQTLAVNIAPFTEVALTFPILNLNVGTNTIRFYTDLPNGGSDERTSNDTIELNLQVINPVSIPQTADLESGALPTNWRNVSQGPASWQITANAARSGSRSIFFNNYDNEQVGLYSDIVLPPVQISGLDSIALNFDLAAAVFGAQNLDTLEVLVSTDCGRNFQSVYKRWGTSLTNVTSTQFYVPTAAQWRRENINLAAFRGANTLQVIIRNINSFGNNIYLDNISLTGAELTNVDAGVNQLFNVLERWCAPQIAPDIAFTNFGADTIRSITIAYQLNGTGPIQRANFSGAVPRFGQVNFSMPSAAITAGNNIIRIWTENPNGQSDEFNSNDTLVRSFVALSPQSLPVLENFESGNFLNNGWEIKNRGTIVPWQLNTTVGFNSNGSIWSNHFNNPATGTFSELITPLFNAPPADSMYVAFRSAAAYNGNIQEQDSLEILLSTSCGLSFLPIQKISLRDLSRLESSVTTSFVPNSRLQWALDSINITALLGQINSFYLVFRNINNFGNNLYLDDIRVYTRTLPDKLKEDGLLVAPTLVNTRVSIQHFRQPTALRYVRVVNGLGAVLEQRTYSGEALSYFELDLSRLSAGVYYIQLGYTDRTEIRKIVKQ